MFFSRKKSNPRSFYFSILSLQGFLIETQNCKLLDEQFALVDYKLQNKNWRKDHELEIILKKVEETLLNISNAAILLGAYNKLHKLLKKENSRTYEGSKLDKAFERIIRLLEKKLSSGADFLNPFSQSTSSLSSLPKLSIKHV